MYNINFIKSISIRGWFTLLTLILTISLYAQNATLKGVIVDETDTPLIGATVQVKGTSTGSITDFDGNYTIKANKGAVITFSYIGYKTQEIKFTGQPTVNIKMVPDNQTLDEVVVVGYGTMKRSDLTGSVASIAAKDVEGFKTSSVAGALGGQIAGVQITSTDGTPGAGFSINIRGVGTLTGDSSPLYIVDGFEVDDIDYLSNSDIESIEILKDASSSAIYGARAANGVVLISTKSGKVGKPIINYNGSASYRKISKKLDVLSPYEFVKLQGEVNSKYSDSYFKTGNDDDGNPYRYQSLDDYIGVNGVNWQDETFNPTWSQDHSLSIMGGTEDTKYNASFSRYIENGIFKNSGFNKTTGKFRLDQKLNKSLSFNFTVNYALTNREGVGTSGDSGRFNMLAQILSARPTGGLKLTDEELLASAIDPEMLESGESLAQVNPVKQTESVTNNKRAEMWSGNASATWQIIKGLTFKTSGTYNTTNNRTDIFYKDGSKEAYRNGQKPYGRTQMGRDVRWTNSNNLTWKQKVKKHNYDIMLGHEVSFKSTEYLLGEAMDFPFDNLGNDYLGLGATPSRVESSYSEKTLLSFFARGNYNYDNRYLFTATVRADGSTVFSNKNKWGFFPSFSAAWRVSEEAFMKDVEWVSNFKVRLGWGIVGNDRISNYLSMDLYEANKYGIGNNTVTVLTPKQLKNANLKWEGASSVNLGVDLGFFDNRLNVTADFFIKDTKDLLLAQSLAHVTGFDSQMQNIGKIQNKGIELSLNSTNIQTRNFTWQTNFNISFIKNTLKGLASGVESMYARSGFDSNFTAYDYIATVGQSLGLIYGYEFDGIYQSSDFYTTPDNQLILKEGITNNARYGTVKPGVVKYKDQDGDGIITTNDRTVIGNAMPKWYGGITNTFNYKGIDFSFMFQFNYGNDIYNATRLYATQSRSGRRNMLAEVADRWSPTNASNKVPSQDGYIVNDVYSRFIEDGSFLRLKNITLGYTLPHKWTRKFHASKLRIYATGQNLFCISGYSGYDPEVNSASSNPMTPGLDWGAYPKSRVFTFGIDLQF
ncbi:Outer membrane TonB-dependent transporter, utilization system for glycans and polysaccharides (PUL), SusC family [Bacteroides ovatus]|jgi:tonB-linked outer membrane protein, susC/ragA family|uniref:SusC/RagA family TonB-linked outer membrane protein n=1 Tax=Bacteroides TaxID=816 RepID=UPI000E91AF68|nr:MULTISPECIES: TonB-dependent receptor [Bacteroides]MCS3177350.1 TonB-dependent receptor [Candidatus Bacteroides intestinigallinarum]RGN60828.1 TonB-dependent receptor [Bacteroides sp. OM05-10AA]RGQ65228.1 TonB-dependent receptor [Bacteroides sp. AF27-33]CAG9888741.1 Outer membrane TonB-dependent transporter, utilization system for glycans and polysaccharides (PUL), SusC family [Bacteroides ovatus]